MVDATILEQITGIPHTLDGPYLVCAEPDGKPYIARWDIDVLGPRPTEMQIATAQLVNAIAVKSAAIQAAKVAARDSGFDVDGTHFDSDAAARISYGELSDVLRADPAYTTPWRASPGAWVTMDAALYAQVQTAGAVHIRSVFAWQAARDADLAAIQAAVAAGTMSEADARAAVEAVSTTYEVTA